MFGFLKRNTNIPQRFVLKSQYGYYYIVDTEENERIDFDGNRHNNPYGDGSSDQNNKEYMQAWCVVLNVNFGAENVARLANNFHEKHSGHVSKLSNEKKLT